MLKGMQLERLRKRQGMSLIVVMVVLLVLVGGGTFMLQRATRQRYIEAHRATSGRIAQELAESGLNLGFEALRQGSLDPSTELHALLIQSPRSDLEGVSLPLSLAPLQDLVAALEDEAAAELTLELFDLKGFQDGPDFRGLRDDPHEKSGRLSLTTRATVRGTTRVFRAHRPFKVIQTRVPLLSKFTLFLRDQGPSPVNLLGLDRLKPDQPMRGPDGPGSPLVLVHREDRLPTVAEGLFHDLSSLFGDLAPDQGGLVFLGGTAPWNLNLVHGTGVGRFDELFHLRRTRYQMPAEVDPSRVEFPLFFGFYDGVLEGPVFHPPGLPKDILTRGDGSEVPPETSALHLFGDVADVSPTVVLGPVFRSYVFLKLLDGLWFPHLSPAEFAGVAPESFPGDYSAYARHMAQVVQEPYNRSVDFIRTNSETLEGDGHVRTDPQAVAIPGPTLLPEALTRLQPVSASDPHFLYPDPEDAARTRVRLLRPPGDLPEAELFRGDPQDFDGATLESLLLARVVEEYASLEELQAKRFRAGILEIQGVTRIQAPEITLGKTNLGDSGILVVDGDIHLEDFVQKYHDTEPSALVSLQGSIHVKTQAPIQAHLVALRGQVHFATATVDIHGALAADHLDFSQLSRGFARKRISYDETLDPTQPEGAFSKLRLFLDPRVGLELSAREEPVPSP